MVQMSSSPFSSLAGKKYVSLASFRKNGNPVRTPLWFGERDGKLYIMMGDNGRRGWRWLDVAPD